ncbi:hypothetical protein PV328_002850 [Microctonus aethiopoides]|uniref:L27 domain-containing protein n=1 Tax=Microctonus aethiopoides TaxID=144406 RepID=A0AA39F7B7_9HYME|nr:hypothetical protein PV328_002850 [Microctonus aethiopoides]
MKYLLSTHENLRNTSVEVEINNCDPAIMYVAAKKHYICFGKKTNNETLSNISLEFQLVWYRILLDTSIPPAPPPLPIPPTSLAAAVAAVAAKNMVAILEKQQCVQSIYSPACSRREAHRALELLEDYHAKLTRPQDKQLRLAIERVIRIFKSKLFQALLDYPDD